MNTLKKLIIPSLLLTGVAISPSALAQDSFDGHNVNVKFEMWAVDADNNITSVLAVRNEQDIAASDMTDPDVEDFHAMDENFNLWDIDFDQQSIELTFRSIEIQDHDNQYMYMSPVGFHIEDKEDSLSDILNVTVDDSYAPSMFNKDLVSFDANNITVSLQGSMCHIAGMGSMPMCDNPDSPTGYNSIIKLRVLLAGTADALFDWIETEYPEYFPNHQESEEIIGYHARYYPQTNLYVGTLGGQLFAYGDQFGGLLNAGDINTWLDKMPMDMHEHDHGATTQCPEGQHFMADTDTCMDNDAMM